MQNNKVKYLKKQLSTLQLERGINQSHKEETTKHYLFNHSEKY